ncbi:DesA family fatty acid desaturase [Orrella daihaiensis]|uniref:Fatty acid desaturase n=1 Tax=Orrella daihaiensis TaxID=2782176 RepID=A0ABY4AG60_9BURK|nr:fatty acid desaturase [Orrella daihaiensis]UOD49261.1 fatty acid desaturase [Orrella daihaiensis]
MDTLISLAAGGIMQASWWEILLYTLVMTHITIVAVTIYLHRSQAHRGVDLHPAAAHFFRFWLWMTTGMVTKEWVSIHRKHHARCEREGDPHSPMIYGIGKVMFRGAELYRDESKNAETLKKFGYGTPDDWMERHVYSKHSALGILIMLGIDLALFGAIGLTVWAVQMAWIPFWAAGVVNGLGHYWGYRNFASPDTSTNVFPIGIIIGGEELHNNHHAYGTSAKFSSRWFEIDIGWGYLQILKFLGLAEIRKVAPKLKLETEKATVDQRTLQGVIAHRYEVLARYSSIMRQACHDELAKLKQKGGSLVNVEAMKSAVHWLGRGDETLAPAERERIDAALSQTESLSTMVQMRRELMRLWESSSASSEQLLHDLQAWCQRAQQSGISSLQEFALRLRRYAA